MTPDQELIVYIVIGVYVGIALVISIFYAAKSRKSETQKVLEYAKEEVTKVAEAAKGEIPEVIEGKVPEIVEEIKPDLDKVSTDMTAKEARDYIRDNELKDLQDFVPDDEDRVTVQRVWKTKNSK